jgi:hypothetical protein
MCVYGRGEELGKVSGDVRMRFSVTIQSQLMRLKIGATKSGSSKFLTAKQDSELFGGWRPLDDTRPHEWIVHVSNQSAHFVNVAPPGYISQSTRSIDICST